MCYLRLLFLISASPRNVLSGEEQGEMVTASWAIFFVFFSSSHTKLLNVAIIVWVQLTGL